MLQRGFCWICSMAIVRLNYVLRVIRNIPSRHSWDPRPHMELLSAFSVTTQCCGNILVTSRWVFRTSTSRMNTLSTREALVTDSAVEVWGPAFGQRTNATPPYGTTPAAASWWQTLLSCVIYATEYEQSQYDSCSFPFEKP